MISLTPDQRDAVECEEDLMLSACPGSGKTRVIIAKLLKLAEAVEDTPRSIGCITYTNAAVDEIEDRVKQFGTNALAERCEIATIHSFCLKFILRPYRWMLPELPAEFRILTRDMRYFDRLVRAVEDEQSRRVEFRTFEDYASVRMGLGGVPVGTGIEGGVVTEVSARRYWELMQRAGFIDFSMILYYSLRILQENPFVARGLSSRFAWLLIDEFQDTTDVQIEILRCLRAHMNSQFFLVGDEHQSIHAFAGARPDLARGFSTQIAAREDVALSGNFRSAPQIIVPAQTLIPRTPAMVSAGAAAATLGTVEYRHVANPVDAITDYFIPLLQARGIPLGNAAVLAPWWRHLIPVARRLRAMDVPVFGPGARPYQRRRVYAHLAEQLGACVASETLAPLPGVEKAIFRLVSEAMGTTRFDIFSYAGRCVSLALVYEARRLAEIHPGGMEWLEVSSEAIANILRDGDLINANAAEAIVNSVGEMRADMERNRIDIANLQIADLGLFADPTAAIKLITMHNSKGREFDAVAIINANQGQIPHFMSRTEDEIEEARRLFYVGLTRAKIHLLVFSDRTDRRNPPSPFIAGAELQAELD